MQAVPDRLDQREEDQRHHGDHDGGHHDEAKGRVAIAGGATLAPTAGNGDCRHCAMAFCVASAMFCIA